MVRANGVLSSDHAGNKYKCVKSHVTARGHKTVVNLCSKRVSKHLFLLSVSQANNVFLSANQN